MPPGMCLKSYGESSNLFDPHAQFPLRAFARAHRTPYHPSAYPVPLASFVAYGEAFRAALRAQPYPSAPDPPSGGISGHELQFDNGESVLARRVIVAVGSLPFSYTPPLLANMPPELLSHSSQFGPIQRLAGKRVIVIGAAAFRAGSGGAALATGQCGHDRGTALPS